jgi:low density lipoprotein-related protein 2
VDRPNKLGIDFDYNHGRLFWVDSTQLNVMSSALDGSQVQTVASSGFQTVERVAYDWITQKVYWSDYGAAKIGIVDLRSGIWKVLIVTGQKQHSRPRALELDPLRRNMYWVDWLEDRQNAVIERASMDGQNRQIIVPTSLAMPYGITLDIASEKLYFIDSYHKRIESVNTDGTGRQQLHLFRTDIVAYSLVFHNGFLYWTDRLSQAISRLQIEGGAVNNVTIADVRPTGLTLIAPQRQPQVDNPCSTSGCSDICILSSSDVRGFTCACAEGVDLLEDTLTCTGSSPVSPSTTIHLAPSSTGRDTHSHV